GAAHDCRVHTHAVRPHRGPPVWAGRGAMMLLLAVGCSWKNTPVDLREKLAFDAAKQGRALDELGQRYGCEAVILSTCNRVELYIARTDGGPISGMDAGLLAEFLGEMHQLPA